jgi:predicted dehydrogenase
MYKVGIIGAGGIAESHINACLVHNHVYISSIADINARRTAKLIEDYSLIATAYEDYSQMLEKEDLDFVIINLPHFLHMDCAMKCAAKGIDVLLEKPMAMNTDECSKINKAVAENKTKLMVGHVIHYYPETILAKKLMDSGELGELLMVNDFRSSAYFTDDRPAWFLDRQKSGGGILMNLGAHSLDRILWITGRKALDVSAYIELNHPVCHVEGHARVNLTLEGNIPATITVYGYEDYSRNGMELYFTKGVIEIKYGEGVKVYRDGMAKSVEGEFKDPFFLQLEDFIAVIENRISNPIPGEYGTQVVSLIQQAYELSAAYQKAE